MDPRRRLLAHAWLQLALWVAIAGVVNHLASARFARFDVTRDHRYSLSDPARKVVSNLDKPLLAKVWFTSDLDPPFHNHEVALRDKLEELRAWSDGKLEIVAVDPTGDRAAMEEAKRFGVQPVPYVYKNWDREETRVVFMGVSFVYGDRQEAVDALPSVDKMEYELVRAIQRVRTEPDERAKIAWLQGNGEPDLSAYGPDNPLGQLREQLRSRYTVVQLDPGDEPIAEDIDTLLVVGPQLGVTELTQFHLDQFVMRGGSVAWFLSGIQPDFQSLRLREVRHDLHGLLGHYGVQLHRDVLLDRKQNVPIQAPVDVAGQLRYARVNYPLALRTASLDRTQSAVRNVQQLVVPFAGSLAVAAALPDGLEAEVWAQTGPDAVSTRQLGTLEATALAQPRPDEVTGPFPLAVALSGRFPSFFATRPPPTPTASDAAPFDPAETLLESRPTRMVVVSSSDMVANNQDFVLNAVDWLQQDPSLIAIRARDSSVQALSPPSPAEIWKWRAFIAGLPLLLIGLGGLVQLRRSR